MIIRCYIHDRAGNQLPSTEQPIKACSTPDAQPIHTTDTKRRKRLTHETSGIIEISTDLAIDLDKLLFADSIGF